MKKPLVLLPLCALGVASVEIASCQSSSTKSSGSEVFAPIPDSLTTPDDVETRLGTLGFFDGYEAVAVGNATARAISFHSRDTRAYFYEGSGWFTAFVGGSSEFLRESGGRDLDSRTMFHYPYTAVTPAMAIQMVGVGSQYGVITLDADGSYLDGSKTYRLTMPKGIPAKDFWSFVLYDPQTRSLLQTPRTVSPSLSSQSGEVEMNEDGSYTVWFGPEAPAGKEKNWIQTIPGKGWFTVLRLYGPLEPWFDQTWNPGEIELID